MKLTNSIIDKVCSDTKFKCSGDDCFILHVGYDYGTTNVDIKVKVKVKVKVKTKIKNINEDSTISASIYINGYKENEIINFKNLDEYICYLNDKEKSLDHKIGEKLVDFMYNILD